MLATDARVLLKAVVIKKVILINYCFYHSCIIAQPLSKGNDLLYH